MDQDAPRNGDAVAQRARLEDVARETGLSTATISRCLNTPGRVAAPTRERVMEAVERLRYTPDFGARALASRRTGTIGVVVPTLDNAIFARGLQSFTERLAASQRTPLIAASNYDADAEDRQIRTLAARGSDAFLLIGTERHPRTRDYLRDLGRPYVLAWSIGGPGERFVGFDNRAAARDLANAVMGMGHERIAMIAGRTAMNDRAARRVDGVRGALNEAGLDGDAMPVVEAAYEFEATHAAVDRLFARAPRPTALICGNDVLAIGAIQRLKSRGLRVPYDVSVTGFDDIELAGVIEPALTTVHVPHRRMGDAAADLLVRALEGDDAVSSRTFETTLMHRASLRPPPRRSP